jgi:Calx-beta domain
LNKPDYFAGRRIGRRIAIGATVLSTVFGGLLSLGVLQKPVQAALGDGALEIGDVTVIEGNSGTTLLQFPIKATTAIGAGGCDVLAYVFGGNANLINYPTPGSPGPDYQVVAPDTNLDATTVPGGKHVHFNAGDVAGTTKYFEIEVFGDTVIEPNETLFGNLTFSRAPFGPSCYGIKLSAIGTITNDDTAPVASRGIWSLTAPAPTLEGNTGATTSAAFVLKTTETLTEPCGIAFNLTLGATGIIGSDYEFPLPPAGATPAVIGTPGDVTKITYYASSATGFYLRFPEGTLKDSTFEIPINITGDPYYEADETVPAAITSFNLLDGLGTTLGCGYDAVGPFVATATIKNDDPIPSAEAGIFSLTGPAPTVEGDAGNTTAAFTLTTSKATTVNCGVAINVWNVTAAAGVDYDLSIPPAGSTPGAFFVPGDPTKLTYYPFNSIGYWLRIPANTPAGAKFTIPVDIKGDLLKEADETFLASFTTYALNDGLGTIGCGYDPLAPATWSASATITDDDTISAGTWAITGPAPTIEGNSGNTPAVFTLSTSKDVTINCGIAINVVNGTAIAGFDYDLLTPPAGATPAALFTPGDPTQVTYYAFSATGYFLRFPKGTPAGYKFSIPVNVKGDVYFEADETFSTTITSYALAGDTLGTVGCGYDPLAPATFTAKATIVNDDVAPVFNLTGPDSVVEGNTGTTPATYKITSATGTATAAPCQVLFTALNETAIWPIDWKVAGESTNFFKTITIDGLSANGVIDIVGDTFFEADETYTVNIVGTGANPCPVDLTKRIVRTKIVNDETTLDSSQLTFAAPGSAQPGVSITGGTGAGTGAAAAPAASATPSTTAAPAAGSGTAAASSGNSGATSAGNAGGSSGNSTTTTTAAPAIIPAADIAPAPAAPPAVGKSKVLGEVASVAYTGASSSSLALFALACIALGLALLKKQRRRLARRS